MRTLANPGKEDPGIIAVMDGLRSNYTVEEPPGMGQQGCAFCLPLLTKALTGSGEEGLRLANGARVRWRDQVAARLLNLQKPDGSCVNLEPRWWEADSVIVTC